MILLLLLVLLGLCAFVTGTYGLYFLLILRTSKKPVYLKLTEQISNERLDSEALPDVSVLVPTYNEEALILRKLQDIAESDYPKEKIEVLVLDDCSSDGTRRAAQEAMDKLGLQGKILSNERRVGPNVSYNKGFAQVKNEFALMTDADITMEKDALRSGVKMLMHFQDVGGVTAKTKILSGENTSATRLETTYRGYYDSSLTAESAMYSTFPGGCAYALLRKDAFTPMPANKGSCDGNISLSIVKKGFRYLYVPQIIFHETISQRMSEQRRQKVRRSARLIQSTLMNRDILFNPKYGDFGKIVFPLRFAMLTICPALIFVSLLLGTVLIFLFSYILGIVAVCLLSLCLLLGMKTSLAVFNVLSSFLAHQLYLLLGLILSKRRTNTWLRNRTSSTKTHAKAK